MILLRHDCLVFKSPGGEAFPYSAEEVTLEIIGDAIDLLDEQTIKQASEAVLHYFKTELGKTSVTIGEFSMALEHALRSLGLHVQSSGTKIPIAPRVIESDLAGLAAKTNDGLELIFFSQLRVALQEFLLQRPDIVRFRRLRDCVKHLRGARRWTRDCQSLNDQIVDYLRTCFNTERQTSACALVVT
jgi:hypothetical protein